MEDDTDWKIDYASRILSSAKKKNSKPWKLREAETSVGCNKRIPLYAIAFVCKGFRIVESSVKFSGKSQLHLITKRAGNSQSVPSTSQI
ncbi:hypothetical protein ACROYT_G005240 [Oculina patagonica]